MTQDNHCGSCTACCRVYTIPELSKPAGKWCDHCAIGNGCKTYNDRPQVCVEFECLWLQARKKSMKLSDDLRPDKCKVVFNASTNPRIITGTVMPGTNVNDVWQKPSVRSLINTLLRGGMAVALGEPAGKTQLVFKPDGSQTVVEMTEPDENGMQWSKTDV